MTGQTLAHAIAAAGQHPAIALCVVAIVAFSESLAVVGTVVPAALVMFVAGVLVGHGALGMAAALGWATLGAIAGDALSYELGRHSAVARRLLPMAQRRPALLAKGQDLIQRRGAASVAIARFTGPLRAFLPLLAGLGRMPRRRFYVTNVLSALLWAPVHILPGALLGSSLQMAEAVSGRLALLLVLLALLLWLAVWLVTSVHRRVAPWATRGRTRLLAVLRQHDGRIPRMARGILEPAGAGGQAMLVGAVLLLAAGGLFLFLLEDVITNDPLVQADRSVFTFLQQLRTEDVDQVMVLITELGSVGVLLPLVVAVLAWLLWRRCWRSARYWIACAAFGELLVQVLKHTLGRARPLALYGGNERFSFPSGHATVSVVVLGFLAFLLARGQPVRWRQVIAAIVAIYVALVGFSRLYLGAHWFSDVMAGLSVGLAWVAFLAMLYTQRQITEPVAPRQLAAVACLAVLVSGFAWNRWRGPADLAMYLQAPQPQAIAANTWRQGGWRELPMQRRELAGDTEERFVLQWACGAGGVTRALEAAGWLPAPPWTPAAALLVLTGTSDLAQRPVLPRLDGGRRASLNFLLPAPHGAQQRQILRLWRSDAVLAGATAAVPVWYGSLYEEQPRRHGFGLREVPVSDTTGLRLQLQAGAGPQLPTQPADPTAPLLLACGTGTGTPP
ncbi:bifunctional DedA family/phosphatase PAP2 family protein [Ramlibacter sp.]|uniref:bifunctional DedA family/phosphatase PAP2 family protein n=1 Tax=Ramlibacter sp. TaxID=1917967 RepID=UPI00262075C7|nr:bifunctional DedA family/phosphatase PAP2 family protein [Ramlibacter sp.]MDB5956506.1 phosphoesterase, PA-phosphatase related [Ramlibacter sp.]